MVLRRTAADVLVSQQTLTFASTAEEAYLYNVGNRLEFRMPPHFFRTGYVAEFLLALIAVLTLWSEAGGQGHLDLMPWYAKLVLSLSVSFAVVGATVAAVQAERAWNRRTLRWVVIVVLLTAGMAALTYYYHLHEEDEDSQDNDSVAMTVGAAGSARCA